MDPADFGRKIKDGCYVPEWFSGPQFPDCLFGVMEKSADGRDATDVEELESNSEAARLER